MNKEKLIERIDENIDTFSNQREVAKDRDYERYCDATIYGLIVAKEIIQSEPEESKEVEIDQFRNGWIPVEERLPECEEKVWVTIERHRGDKIYKFTCLAIYEDGNMWDEDSGYSWHNFDNAEYDEEREDFKVPRGWYESVYYAEEFSAIDDFVIAWKPLPEPYDPLEAGIKRVLQREHDRISGKE